MLIDSHAHITGEELYSDIDGVLARAQQNGIHNIVNICTDEITLMRGLGLSQRYPWVHQVAACHPHDVEKEGKNLYPLIEKAAREGYLKAIGEIGLDYHYSFASKETQQQFLRDYLHLAMAMELPVVIHCREAFDDFFSILDAEYTKGDCHGPGVLHCFTGTMKEAEEVLKRDWYLSLSGIVTFKKSVALQEVAQMVPLERLLIETDSPFLAPQTKRGKKNEPSYLLEIAEYIAKLRGIGVEEIGKVTSENARRLFKLRL